MRNHTMKWAGALIYLPSARELASKADGDIYRAMVKGNDVIAADLMRRQLCDPQAQKGSLPIERSKQVERPKILD